MPLRTPVVESIFDSKYGEYQMPIINGYCTLCPPNTYKDFVGNGECTPCPDTLISPSGSKSVSECGRVLHIGDKIYHLKSVKQTSPSLHIRDENGNVWYGNLYSEQE